MALGAALGVVQGLTGVVGGLIGGGKRRREQRRAQQEFNRRKAQFMNLDTSNVYANMENVYEDLTVNQRQAEFQAQQQQQVLANTMSGMQGAAGGSGIAALAQAMANQQSQNMERASISIGQQEAQNQAAKASMAGQLQMQEAKGELLSREAVAILKKGHPEVLKFSTNIQMPNKGVPKAFPPLASSDYLKDIKATVNSIKYGLNGPIVVNGVKYNSVMAPMGLDDQEVADVTNYILNTWGNRSLSKARAMAMRCHFLSFFT